MVSGLVVVTPLYIDRATEPHIFYTAEAAPTSTVALVLGASVVSGEPSPALRERALGALALYRAGKVEKILVSGDDSVEGFDEVSPVRRLLQEEGVEDSDIFLDHAGFDTYSSMYRARDVFAVHDAIIVTQGFHVPRAVFLAHQLGLEAAGLAVAERGDPVTNQIREWGASVKAMIDLTITRVPKYLGPQFPIVGDGQETWE
jgi:SanA protein